MTRPRCHTLRRSAAEGRDARRRLRGQRLAPAISKARRERRTAAISSIHPSFSSLEGEQDVARPSDDAVVSRVHEQEAVHHHGTGAIDRRAVGFHAVDRRELAVGVHLPEQIEPSRGGVGAQAAVGPAGEDDAWNGGDGAALRREAALLGAAGTELRLTAA